VEDLLVKMRAAVLYETGKPLVVEDGIEVPRPGRGQVLVRIHYTGVCQSQVMEVRGRRGPDPYLPHLLGHEATASVLETGEGVAKVRKGDKVVLTWIKSEGIDAPGAKYEKDGITINSGGVSTFSEYSVVSENRCVSLPEGVPLDMGSLLGCAVPTGAGIVVNEVKPEKGSSIAFFGLGGIGMTGLLAAQMFDCSEVIAVDIDESKLKRAREFGATHVVNAKEHDPVKTILDLTEGGGVDYAVEAAGISRTIEQAFESVRRGGGLCVFATHPAHGEKVCLDPHELISGKQIRGSWGGSAQPDRDVPFFAAHYREGRFPIDKLITGRYTLSEINHAFDDLESGISGRPIVKIEETVKA
jgi:S-(hydroxymethyl)glutathione dehydrogenase/alcohol dehydrogenase